jgi:MraZ protein
MTQFLGTHHNRLDAKGRVSVPAPFRAALRAHAERAVDEAERHAPTAAPTLVLRPSHTHACIEGWPAAVLYALATPLDRLDLFGEAHDILATTLFGEAHPIEPDKEGRIVLPEPLITHAGLAEGVTFMGLGRIFQIWEPAAAARRLIEARERARGVTLPGIGG